jgi:hypothetical protein
MNVDEDDVSPRRGWPTGSELSHPVAPANEGICTRSNRSSSAQRAERLADVC